MDGKNMLKKQYNILKRCPVLLGFAGIVIVMVCILLYWLMQRQSITDATIVPEELSREQTIDGIVDPKQSVEYFLSAVKKQDLDGALRIFPIDEICLRMNSGKIIEQIGEFYPDTTLAPSVEYEMYFPISSAELTAKYAEEIETWMSQGARLGEWKIEKINYILPSKQKEANYRMQISQQCDMWGADGICDVLGMIDSKGDKYIVTFRLASYYGYWKIFSFETSLLDDDQKEYFKKCAEDKYWTFVQLEEEKAFESRLERIVSDKSKSTIKGEKELVNQKLSDETALLSPNYFITNNTFYKEPIEVIRQFNRFLQKKDLTMALTYGNYSFESVKREHVSAEVLISQGQFAKEIKSMYYSIFRAAKELSFGALNELGESGNQVIESLDTKYAFYLELMDIRETKKSDIFNVYYYYEGNHFEVPYTMKKWEEGWQIEKIGKVKVITEQEYEKIEKSKK